jgi:hypothetical protein
MGDRNRPQEPDWPDDDIDLGAFRGVVLDDDTTAVQIVSEPPSAPAQPPSPAPEDSAEKQ